MENDDWIQLIVPKKQFQYTTENLRGVYKDPKMQEI